MESPDFKNRTQLIKKILDESSKSIASAPVVERPLWHSEINALRMNFRRATKKKATYILNCQLLVGFLLPF